MNTETLKAFLVFLVIFALITAAAWAVWPSVSTRGMSSGYSGERIALVYVQGAITGSTGSGGVFAAETGASSVMICDQLYRALDDPSVKGVLLRINSPGGSAAASDEIYRAVLALREAGKPVVVSMGDVAASGGYYIASAADYIYANGATLTGSIGVVFSLMNWEEAATKIGIKNATLTAGEYKDIGTPWREMTEDERGQLTELMIEVHDQFIVAVSEGRQNLTEEEVREYATGMIFTGQKAAEIGLIDEIGSMYSAENKIRELSQVDSDVPIEEYIERTLFDELFMLRGSMPFDLFSQFGADQLTNLAGSLYLNTTVRDLIVR